MTLFEECLEALGSCEIVSERESGAALEALPLTDYGHLDKKACGSFREVSLSEMSEMPDFSYYVIWDNAEIPVIKCRLKDALNCLDDVLAVSFITWLLAEDFSYAAEFHEGRIILGKLPAKT